MKSYLYKKMQEKKIGPATECICNEMKLKQQINCIYTVGRVSKRIFRLRAGSTPVDRSFNRPRLPYASHPFDLSITLSNLAHDRHRHGQRATALPEKENNSRAHRRLISRESKYVALTLCKIPVNVVTNARFFFFFCFYHSRWNYSSTATSSV